MVLKLDVNDIHNQTLIGNVHPAHWQNPEPEAMYNLVVIGAGAAGLISSIIAGALGGKVALIEQNLLGGDCLNVGCVPSKSLIRSARLAQEMRHATELGLGSLEISDDSFFTVMQRIRRIRAEISQNDSADRYKNQGVDVFFGDAQFISKHDICVSGAVLNFKKAIIATGARPIIPAALEGLKEIDYLTNETIFNLTEKPQHLIMIGGGPISCELAQAFNRLGVKISIIQRGHLLSNIDTNASELLLKTFQSEGIQSFLFAKILHMHQLNDGRKSIVIEHDGQEKTILGDQVFLGLGRAPNIENLGLEFAGIDWDLQKGIIVDDFLRTSNRRVYAAGDCCVASKFTYMADASAQIAVQNSLFWQKKRLSDLMIPTAIYTDPEVAQVGMHPKIAEEKGIAVTYFYFDMHKNDRAIIDNESQGFIKIMLRKGSDEILGATIVAKHASEMISEITTCIQFKIGLSKMAKVIRPYPTQSDVIKRIAVEYNKSRLTPNILHAFKFWLKLQRTRLK